MAIASAIIGGLSLGASAIMSGRQSGRARRRARQFERKLSEIESNRQAVVNPFANVTNPYENLQVATGAARMQAEEQDISLANTLDTLRATGASAGGATALAQAALRGKQGIANTIQQQEATNARLRAEGQANQERLMAQGEMFRFKAQEARENQLLNRYAGLGQEQRRLQAGYNQQLLNTISSAGSAAMSFGAGLGSVTK